MIEEKKQRDHLLQLNQILAQQVMEKSKAVACKLDFIEKCVFEVHGFYLCYIVCLFCVFLSTLLE